MKAFFLTWTATLLVASGFRLQANLTKANPIYPLRRWGYNGEAEDLVLVDAGSSGSKVFAFSSGKGEGKLLTRCTDENRQAGRTNQGIAALAYSKAECAWQIGSYEKELKPLAKEQPDYAKAVLELLADTYKRSSGKSTLEGIRNRHNVPILATAGMRLLSQAANSKVWSYVCGQSGSGLTLAEGGQSCGTIPGTTEAYYEYLANAAQGAGNKVLTGTFTIGGASAQISIPLKTQKDVADFTTLRATIKRDLDCAKLKLADGSTAPVFNKEGYGETSKCVDDYITFMPKSEIKASAKVKTESIRISEIQGLGLISFLGLDGRGTFVAGGVNAIQSWAVQMNCDKKTSDFAACVLKLQKALSSDIMWKHVTTYFKSKALNIDSFSYNTYAAMPAAAGLPVDKTADQAWKLKEELDKKCGADNSAKFGYKNKNTCMKALFTSMYVTSFFARDADSDKKHLHSEIHHDPERDWSEGKVEDLALLTTESAKATVHSLLNVSLPRHTTGYMHGAKLHMAAAANGGPRGEIREKALARRRSVGH